MTFKSPRFPPRRHHCQNGQRFFQPFLEVLEDRRLLAFSVLQADMFATGGLHLTVDFNAAVKSSTVAATDLLIDGSPTAAAVNVLDADTVDFLLPALSAGAHTVAFAAGSIQDTSNVGLDAFSRTFNVAAAAQYAMKHSVRLQPGNAPLAGYTGGDLDRADLLWQTIPGGAGAQDSFQVEYRATGSVGSWQSVGLNAAVDVGVESRVVWSASITGLNWNSDYTYRVRHFRGDVIVDQYQHSFHTRLPAGDTSAFTFAAYGDSADAAAAAAGFREVQGRINQVNPAFTVLLGDNVYDAGTHQQSDARFDPLVNPEAAAWMAEHIDYLGLGNHDVGTGSGQPSEQNYSVPIPVAGVTAPAAPPATERAEHNFSWDYGDVHFITFDTNSLSDATRLDGLLKWVVADLQASTARWKIVYGHHPLAGVPDKPESPGDNYYQQVVNRLKAAGVDLFMTGHSHTYSWTYPLTGQINGAATFEDSDDHDHFLAGVGLPQLVSGLGGRDIRTGDFTQFPFVAAGYTASTAVAARLGFSKVDVTPSQLTVSYVAADNGAVLDSFVISKEDNQLAQSFQQGANGYNGAVDTFLYQNTPAVGNGSATSLKVDGDDPAGTGLDSQALLRFDNLFGSGPGQIPANATLRTATLQLQTTNGGDSINLHRLLGTWSAADTWGSATFHTNGVQPDGIEAVAAPDTSTGFSQIGVVSFNVLSSLRAWKSNSATNFGWALLPTGNDGVDFNSSEGTVRPKLTVTYVLDAANTPPVAQNDSVSTPQNTPTTIAVLNNDSDVNGDLLAVQSASVPAHGTAVVNANNTITYTPSTGYYGSDAFTYQISDGQGGTASASVSLTIVPANLQTLVFQQGLNGYSGSTDTFLQQNTPTANNDAATLLNIDGDDPAGTGLDVQTLLRFANLFGAGAIPIGATLQSAVLELQVTNAGNGLNLHRMLRTWNGTDNWDTLAGGVQNDETESVAAADSSTPAVGVGLLSINVLSSVEAWQSNPSSNFGWAFLPSGTDGVDFYSAEGTTKPKLTVTYVPNTSPAISDIADQTILENGLLPGVPITVSDIETAATALSLSAQSSNATLFPPGSITFGGSGANRTISLTPSPNQIGTSTVTVTVDDGFGGIAVDSFVVAVTPSTQIVTAVTQTSAGVRFTLSAAAAIAELNLYDYRNPAGQSVLGAADVQLVGATSGAIAGSLVIEPGDTGFTFVSTNGILPPDSYTLTLRSAANGFQTVAGELLDGNADGLAGEDFVTAFTVAAPAANTITVSVPNFARGPEQVVNVPAASSLGLPLSVSNGDQLASLRFVMQFDPGLLSVTGVALPVGAPSGSTANLTPLGPGQVQVSLAFGAPLAAGSQVVAYLAANVPTAAAARYGERAVLDLNTIQITNADSQSIPARDDDALQVNAYFGDVGRNGRYDSFDVQQASRMALRLDTGFQQHPLLDPAILCDFNENNRIDSFDVQRLSRLALRLAVGEVPALPAPLPAVTDTDRLVAGDPASDKGNQAVAAPTPDPLPRHNSASGLRSDIDENGVVDAQDILWAIEILNRSVNGEFPSDVKALKVDVNGDHQFDSADVLFVITDFHQRPIGEGEATAAVDTAESTGFDDLESLTYLLASDVAETRKKK